MEDKKFCIILGTRPEIIKLSSIIRYCEIKKKNYFIIHTNQHYDQNMDKIFFEELNLPKPKYNLNVGSATPGKQTGLMIQKIEETLLNEKPDFVLVQGDTNTALAGAISASKLNIKIGHIEAGLRSYDMKMPEEKNRILIDHISDFLFAPTLLQKDILKKENIDSKKIFVVGNTIVDALNYSENAIIKSEIKYKLNIVEKKFVLLTCHRQENVEDKNKLENIFKGIELINLDTKLKTIYPIHPRTKRNIETLNIKVPKCVKIIEPVGYFDFLWLEKNSKIIITDSGGVQEESCVLKTPCITIRENTERPETINVGANIIVGTDPKEIYFGAERMLNKKNKWKSPFGDGTTYLKIINILETSS